jgi:hypothetical protein
LLEHHLLEELRLWIHPLFVGHGTPRFRESEKSTLKLGSTKTLGTGVVILSYQPAGTSCEPSRARQPFAALPRRDEDGASERFPIVLRTPRDAEKERTIMAASNQVLSPRCTRAGWPRRSPTI